MFFKKKNKRTTQKISKIIFGDFTLIYDYIPESSITQISCEINCGSYHEGIVGVPPGTAHFIEHMVFNGSKDFNKDELQSIKKFGASINAFTGHQATTYYLDFLTGSKNNFLTVISRFISMIFNPQFDKTELEKERSIIIDEMKSTMSNPSITHSNNIALGFKNPIFRNPIIGTLESIEKINVNDLKKLHSKLYRAENAIMYISSSIPFKYAEKYLNDILFKFVNSKALFRSKKYI